MSLRTRSSIAFGVIAALVIALGTYAVISSKATSDLVISLYDEPLIGVSYARAASAALNKARGLMDRGVSAGPDATAELVAALHQIEIDIAEDLRIVRHRVQEPSVASAIDRTESAIAEWLAGSRLILAPPAGGVIALPMRTEVGRKGTTAIARLDDLVEEVTALGFTYRARARAAIHNSNITLASLSGGIIGLSALLAMLFGQLVIRPIRVATRIAEEIADGHMDVVFHTQPNHEIGRLLRSLATMQANLRDRATQTSALLREKDHAAEMLRQINLRFDIALDNMKQGLAFFDNEANLIVCNRRYGELYGLSPSQTRTGALLSDIIDHRIANGSFPDVSVNEYVSLRRDVLPGSEAYFTDELQDGRTIAIHYKTLSNGGAVATHEDITEHRRAEANLAFMAHHDALTRLPNRVLFRERLQAAVCTTGRETGCALLVFDLDHFKTINDTRGHPFGDAMLVAVAERLQSCVRQVDTVARLGGDEFAVILVAPSRPEDAAIVAARILEAFRTPLEIDGSRIVIGTSIGGAVAPGDGSTAEQLQKYADIALYQAKQDGRGMVRFFHPDMDARNQLHRTLSRDLDDAMSRSEFEVYYQPLINLAAQDVTGFEALLRWRHPDRGFVSPADFIPVAEDTGKIVAIGEWVLRTACFEAEMWPSDISVAVNLSPMQFKKGDLVATVKAALEASGLPADRLQLEITEMVQLQDTPGTLAALHQLRAMGVAIALDDFGTGYSSLGYLHSFPFDKIKIDQSFVRDMASNEGSVSIIRAITGLGQSLGVSTTAEGVETREQLDKLREVGCTEVQGYYFSRPKPAREIPLLIENLRGLDLGARLSHSPKDDRRDLAPRAHIARDGGGEHRERQHATCHDDAST